MIDLTSFISEKSLIPLSGEIRVSSSLTLNSKEVKKDGIFIAIPGTEHNGVTYIKEAIQRGANAIIVPENTSKAELSQLIQEHSHVSFYAAYEIRKIASRLASALYPLQPATNIAVTGTNGKTSVVSFIRQIWNHLKHPSASLGTLGLVVEGCSLPNLERTDGLNTPDPVKLHQILQVLKESSVDHLAFEASSHGLHQNRLDNVHLKAGVFTNLTNDHLDYHQTLEAYFKAKCRLFSEVLPEKSWAVLNKDIPEFDELETLCLSRGLRIISFGKLESTIQLVSCQPQRDGQQISLRIEEKTYELFIPLVGEFQVYNIMAALGAVWACGDKLEEIMQACHNLHAIPGRLQLAAPGVYVDYAHTPDGLSVALKALRFHTKGQLWLVFGCGGNRDVTKRPMMGQMASMLADKIILTDDNPRHENPSEIRRQVREGCPEALEIGSRQQAIAYAIKNMKQEDVVLIAGKGHETYQLIEDQVVPFNDVEEVKKCVGR